jgi:lincosamide nucleotidyltransferase A/C/D/E
MLGPRKASKSLMTTKDALDLYDLFERQGITIWIDGGWAVDALLGEQTRSHGDLDIALEVRLLGRLRDVLAERGYQPIPRDDTRPWNFVLGNGAGLEVDVHAFTFNENGDGVYGPPEQGDYYRADALIGEGFIGGRRVRCISPEWLVRFHAGYEPTETDYHDVMAICERFGIELPEMYRHGLSNG